jgi:hypothetical protein
MYAIHRQRVTHLLTSVAHSERDRLCVLGAGNSNDLDLDVLGGAFGEIHLVDLDAEALDFGVDQQQHGKAKRVHRHGGVDVTGVAPQIGNWSPQEPPSADQLQALVKQAVDVPGPRLPTAFDVVASVGLLTQLIDSIVLALGTDHPGFLDLVKAVRLRHLRLLVELLAPGGNALLVTEIVSSDTFPQLPAVSDAELSSTMVALIGQRNFFTGTNPVVLRSLVETDPVIAPLVQNVEILPPWKWQFIDRMYAVCALRVQRRA